MNPIFAKKMSCFTLVYRNNLLTFCTCCHSIHFHYYSASLFPLTRRRNGLKAYTVLPDLKIKIITFIFLRQKNREYVIAIRYSENLLELFCFIVSCFKQEKCKYSVNFHICYRNVIKRINTNCVFQEDSFGQFLKIHLVPFVHIMKSTKGL